VAYNSSSLTEGFISSTITNDDVRYEQGAKAYSETAIKLIDKTAFIGAFSDLNDNVGYSDEFQLWYWVVCIVAYLTKGTFVVHLLNLFFGALCVYYVYKLAEIKYGPIIAKTAANLYAYFPYPVFFCSFLYKDQLVTLIALLIFYIAVNQNVRKKKFRGAVYDYVCLFFLIAIFSFLRSGLTGLLVFIVFIIVTEGTKYQLKFNIRGIIMFLPFAAIAMFFIYYSFGDVSYKFMAYVTDRASYNNITSFLWIKKWTDIYKIPIAFFYALVQPINTGFNRITSWSDIVGYLNIVSIFIAICNLFYLFTFKLKKNALYISFLILYVVTITTSLGIFRHYYYLYPFSVIFATIYYKGLKKKPIFWGANVLAVCLLLFIMILNN
jgi:hypothetical protein